MFLFIAVDQRSNEHEKSVSVFIRTDNVTTYLGIIVHSFGTDVNERLVFVYLYHLQRYSYTP